MSLKAGRKGLNKRLVDAFGNFNGEAPSGEYYTKQQTDNKFETKTHVNNTFQKKTLDVPIEMLSGSKLTVEDALQGLNEEKFTYADNGVLGAKNLLPNNATSQTINGVTFTVNADGSVTANGTATANAVFVIHDRVTDDLNISSGNYIGSGITNGVSGELFMRFFCTRNGSAYVYGDIFNGEITINVQSGDIIGCLINIASGQTVNNFTFYPMLRLASDPDDTYVPYAMTNREITEELTVQESAVTDIVEGATISDLGNHLLKYGKVVYLTISLSNVNITTSWSDTVFRIPEGYRPKYTHQVRTSLPSDLRLQFNISGTVLTDKTLSNTGLFISTSWITD